MMTVTERPSDIRSPSERVVRIVSIYANTDPLELPPLYHTVNPDALDTTIKTLNNGTVEFEYAGYSVTVNCDGTVNVTEDAESGLEQVEPVTDEKGGTVD